jgi:hypothetical protein
MPFKVFVSAFPTRDDVPHCHPGAEDHAEPNQRHEKAAYGDRDAKYFCHVCFAS